MTKFPTAFVKAALVVITLGLTGCGITPNHYVGASVTKEINSVDVYIAVPQVEINADVDPSGLANAGGGGLLLALIDVAVENSRANTAEKLIAPIKDALVEFDFNQALKAAVAKELEGVDWLNVDDIVLVNAPTQDIERSYNTADAEAILYVNAGYSVTADFKSLRAWAYNTMLPKADKLKPFGEKPDSRVARSTPWHLDNNLYRDNVGVSINVVSGKNKDESALKMSQDPKQLRESMLVTIDELAKAIARSLKKNGQADNINKVS